MGEAGLSTDASGVFAPRPGPLQSMFDGMSGHSGGDLAVGLYEMADPTAIPGQEPVTNAQSGLVSTLWQVEKELEALREALQAVHPALASAPSAGLVSALGMEPRQSPEFLLGLCEACVTAAAVATTPAGAAGGGTAQVPPGAVAALLRLQVAAGHGDRAETSLARAHEAGMLLQMRHYEPVLRLRATRRHLREALALLRAMQARGITANADVSDEAYALVVRCVALSLEAGGGAEEAPGGDNADETHMSLQEAQESVAQSVDDTGAAVLTAAEAERVAAAVLGEAQRELSHPGRELLGEVERLFSLPAMRARGWQLARSEIGHDGRCAASGLTLARRQLRGGQLFDAATLIRQVIVEHEAAQATKLAGRIGRGGGGGTKRGGGQAPASVLSTLDRHIAAHGPFDLVVDGANLGLFRRSVPGGYLSYGQLDAIVQHCTSAGLRPLVVLHHRWMRPDDLVPDMGRHEEQRTAARARQEGREEMVGVLGRWRRDCPEALFVVPRGNDDVYWMYAAMQSQRLKLRAAADPEGLGAGGRQRSQRLAAVLREVQDADAAGKAADEAAAAAAAEEEAAAVSAPSSAVIEALALRRTVWLVTNDLMRDHKGELMGWHSFGAWRSGVVKALMDRSPRWYAAGAAEFDGLVQRMQADLPEAAAAAAGADARDGEDDAEPDGGERGAFTALSLQRAARAFMRRRIAGDAPGAAHIQPAAAHTADGESVRAVVPHGSAVDRSASVFAPLGRGDSVEPELGPAAAPAGGGAEGGPEAVPARAVTHARQITAGHAQLAVDQSRRRLWFVLPHAYQLRFHRPETATPAFFFPGFGKAVDEAGGVPDVPDAATRARRAEAEQEVSLDTAFETVVRAAPSVPLWQVAAETPAEPVRGRGEWRERGGRVSGMGPLRWQEDRLEHADTRLVMPPLRQWYVLFKQPSEASERV